MDLLNPPFARRASHSVGIACPRLRQLLLSGAYRAVAQGGESNDPHIDADCGAVWLIKQKLGGPRVAEAIRCSLWLETRVTGSVRGIIDVGALQIAECLRQRLEWSVSQPPGLGVVAPLRKSLAEFRVAQFHCTLSMALHLDRQRLVEHKPAATRDATTPAVVRYWALARIWTSGPPHVESIFRCLRHDNLGN